MNSERNTAAGTRGGGGFISASPDETLARGEELAAGLSGTFYIIALEGDLGAGKTLFTKGIAKGLEVADWYYLNSPTFTLLNEYRGRLPLYHFDLYRLADTDELFELGFSDYLSGPGVLVIEWPEKAYPLLPREYLIRVEISITAAESRRLKIVPPNGS